MNQSRAYVSGAGFSIRSFSSGESLALSLEHHPSTMDATFWNNRFDPEDYIYGEAPNSFLAEVTPYIPKGPVLCLAEGEGRNAVHLALRGYHVTAVDQSEVGLAKAHRLAKARGAEVRTVIRDLQNYHINPGTWAGITAIFAHLPPILRRKVHAEAALGLQPGGVFILEAYSPAQLARGTGGPKSPELLSILRNLREREVTLPVILLTARSELNERLAGLNGGCNILVFN